MTIKKQSKQTAYSSNRLATAMKGNKGVSYDSLHGISYVSSIARICIQIIKETVTAIPYGFTVKNREDAASVEAEIKYLNKLLLTPNPNNDTFRNILNTVIEDVLVFDKGVIEKVRTSRGEVAQLYPVIGKSIKANYDEYGMLADPAYSQYLSSEGLKRVKPDAEFAHNDLMIFQKNPDIYNPGEGKSPVEMFATTLMREVSAIQYNSSWFSGNNIPPFILNFAGAEQDFLDKIRFDMEEHVKANQHAMLFTGNEDVPTKISLRDSNQEMQFVEFYEKMLQIIVSAFGLSIQDVGLIADVNRATAEVQQNISKQRGITSMIRLLEEEVNKDLLGDLALYNPKFELIKFSFEEIDKADESVMKDIYTAYIDKGVYTPNEIRIKLGEEPLEEEVKEDLDAPTQEPEESQEGEEGEGAGEESAEEDSSLEKALSFFSIKPEQYLQSFEKAQATPIIHVDHEAHEEGLSKEKQAILNKVDHDFIEESLNRAAANIVNGVKASIAENRDGVLQQILAAVQNQNSGSIAGLAALTTAQVAPTLFDELQSLREDMTEEAVEEVGDVAKPKTSIQKKQVGVDAQINGEDMAAKLNTTIRNFALSSVANEFTEAEIAKGLDEAINKFQNTTLSTGAVVLGVNIMNRVRKDVFAQSRNVSAFMYSAQLDDRTTQYCSSMHGRVFRADDPGLGGIMPPNHFHCRSMLVPVSSMELDTIDDIDSVDKKQQNLTLVDFKDRDPFAKSVKEEVSIYQQALSHIYG